MGQALQTTDRRSEPRTGLDNAVVQLDACDGRKPILCCILDISNKGACLLLPANICLPLGFKLNIEDTWRPTKVVWRKWGFVGVRFLA
jgi:hypothetical protein